MFASFFVQKAIKKDLYRRFITIIESLIVGRIFI